MKSFTTTITKAVVLAAISSAASLAAAAGSTTLAVTASVSGNCKFTVASTPLGFGSIDPSLPGPFTATANVLYRCTKNTASLGISGITGAHTMNATPVNLTPLSYTLAISGDTGAGLGFGPGNDLTAVVAGTITAAQVQNVIGTGYSENVTLNITP